MAENMFSRTELLLGEEGVAKLKEKHVAVFGVGGVGGFACEGLARAGIGRLTIVDDDKVVLSNLNRQIIALHSTIGRAKVDVLEERLKDINPDLTVEKHRCFYLPETSENFDFSSYDYVVDAIDTVTGKIELVMRAKEAGVPIICAMGAGNKLDPTKFEVSDIHKTSVCPLARVMRREMKKRGIKKLKVVYSKEEAREPIGIGEAAGEPVPGRSGTPKKISPGSISFVPSVMGLIIAGEVVKDLL